MSDDGGQAFPVVIDGIHNINGMTLLDWFAGQVLCGIIARELNAVSEHNSRRRMSQEEMIEMAGGEAIAKSCYVYAAAPVAEKRRREEGT